MRRTLMLVGAGALLAWTGLGLVAWANVARHVTLSFSDSADAPEGPAPLLALQDELGALHQDVRALASALGTNLQTLSDELHTSLDEHAAATALQVATLREAGPGTPPPSDELVGLLRELGALRDALGASGAPGSAVLAQSPPLAEPTPADAHEAAAEPVAAAPAAPRARKSFLAFALPSDDFRFDERRAWSVLPGLSRIGFDAQTTLHDFTATSSSLSGELEADLSQPGREPRARLRLEAATLLSGDSGRDKEMLERLAVQQHPALEFELTRFEVAATDSAKLEASGTAHGRLSVRGVTHEVAMPVRLALDDARRLCVEGEMSLDLEDYGVPVPNKLGLISMEKDVKVWVSLRFRVNPRTEG